MIVEFQLLANPVNHLLAQTEMSSAPLPGELVEIDGKQYRVRGRYWALTSLKNLPPVWVKVTLVPYETSIEGD